MTPTEDRGGVEATARGIAYKHYLRGFEADKAGSDYPERMKPDTLAEVFAWPEYQELAEDIASALHECRDYCWEPDHTTEDGQRQPRVHCVMCTDAAMETVRQKVRAKPPSGLTPPRPPGGATAPDPREVSVPVVMANTMLWLKGECERLHDLVTSLLAASERWVKVDREWDADTNVMPIACSHPKEAHDGWGNEFDASRLDLAAEVERVRAALSVAPASARSAAPEEPERAAPPREASGGASGPALRECIERVRDRLTKFRYRTGLCPFCHSTVHAADCAIIPIMDDTAAALAGNLETT